MIEPRLTVINVAEFYFDDAPGGAARLATDLCTRQVEWGYRVFLVSKKPSPHLADLEQRDGLRIVRISEPGHPPPSPLNLYGHIRNAQAAVHRILGRERDVSVIHVHSQIHGVGAFRAVSKNRIRKVCSVHSPLVHEQLSNRQWESNGRSGRVVSKLACHVARWVESSCYRAADVVTCDSRFSADILRREYRSVLSDRCLGVFPGWIDTDRFCPDGPKTDWSAQLRRRPRGPVFFTVRALAPRNGLEMLIQAVALLRSQGLEFEVVIGGDGLLRPKLQAQIGELSLAGHVTLLGRVDDQLLPALYRSCDAFVLPTRSLECFGIIILEALASGVPVIATPVGAIPELLKPVYPQGLLPDASAEAIADAMSRAIREQGSTERTGDLAERFRAYVCDQYSIEAGTARFRELYE